MPTSDDSSADNASTDNSGSSDSSSNSSSDGSDSSDSQDKNWLEWVVLIVGVAIVLGVVGFLVVQLITGTSQPADLQVALQESTTSGSTVLIPVEVTNRGNRVAEAAVVEVCAGPDACGQVTFSYVPQGSTKTGTVGLSTPLAAPLETRVVSYREP